MSKCHTVNNVDIYRLYIKCKDLSEMLETVDKLEAWAESYEDKGYPYASIRFAYPVEDKDPQLRYECGFWYYSPEPRFHFISACYVQEIVEMFGADRVEGIAEMKPDWEERVSELLKRKLEAENK